MTVNFDLLFSTVLAYRCPFSCSGGSKRGWLKASLAMQFWTLNFMTILLSGVIRNSLVNLPILAIGRAVFLLKIPHYFFIFVSHYLLQNGSLETISNIEILLANN